MFRSVAAITALLILPSLAPAQEISTTQQGTHEVVKGNTLWDLAGHYLGNPFLWPLIYEANRDRIKDPHWIYPGQIFIIPGLEGARGAAPGQVPIQDVTVVAPGRRAGAGEATNLPPCPLPGNRTVFWQGEGGDRGCVMPIPSLGERTAFYVNPETAGIAGTPVDHTERLYAVPRGLVYASPWLEDWEEALPSVGTIARFEAVDMESTPRDRARFFENLQIEVEEGAQIEVGDLLQSFEVGRAEERLGTVVRPTGILAVTEVQEAGAVAMVSAEFGRVRLGQRLRMAPDYALRPGVSAQEVESNLTATLLGFNNPRAVYGIGAVAFLDIGDAEGITIGDEFSAYVNQGDGWSGEEAVRLQVVLVNGAVCSARVLKVTDPVLRVGSPVYLVKKMQ
ncbi:MAG: LysM peptidoglycan-binding domain-containing protein [Longimicrobiales bacterium]